MASRCGVYALRYDRMPIKLVDHTGRIVGESVCGLNSKDETERVMLEIGRGCSLQVVKIRRKK